jgi:hypothetical protein
VSVFCCDNFANHIVSLCSFVRAIATMSNHSYLLTRIRSVQLCFSTRCSGMSHPAPDCAGYVAHHFGDTLLDPIRRLTDDLPLVLFLDRR